jgi:hypothetical protein
MATKYTVSPVKNPTLTPATNIGGYKASSGVAAPQQYYSVGTPSGSVAGTWSTSPPQAQLTGATQPNNTYANSNATGGGGTSAADAAAAAQAAAQAAAAGRARDAITGLAHSILGVYDSLYGNVNQAGADQANQVNSKYDTENTGLTNEFNQEFPTIGNSFAARGAYDSSYRQDAEGNAQQSFQDQLGQQQQGRNTDLAKIGQFVAQNRAGLDANKQGVNAILEHIGGTTDVNELSQIQNAIQQKLIDAQGQSASLGTQGGYLSQIQAIAPTQNQTASLQANLKSIIQGQANPFLKKTVGTKLIQTSGLPDAQKQQLINEFVGSLDQNQQG